MESIMLRIANPFHVHRLPLRRMRTGSRLAGFGGWVLMTLAALGAAPAHAQTKRCDLVGRDTTVSGVTGKFKRCLDLASLKNTTVTVPSNVTRIDNDGLSLCKGSLRLGGDADIVFVVDESGSMEAKYAWINTSVTPRDTLFFNGLGGCDSTRISGTLTYNVFEGTHGQATTTPPTKTVGLLVHPDGCHDNVGDPYNVRAFAVRQAIDSIARSSAISTVGFLGFLALAADAIPPALAQEDPARYPSKPIHIIVGFAAGGAPDALARIISDRLTQKWGQAVVVENRTGANGNIAMVAVAKFNTSNK